MPKLYLKEWRKFLGCPLSDLAETTGLSRSMLSRIENGHMSPSNETVDKISAAFKLKGLDLYRDPTGARLHIEWGPVPKSPTGLH